MGKHRRYTDEERATLVAMLLKEGYPDKVGALQYVAEYAKVHTNVLRRWFRSASNPPPTKIVTQKVFELKTAIREELDAIFSEMDSKRDDATYRDLGVVAGIMMDKARLLDDQPTERIAIEHSGQVSIDERRQRIADILNTDAGLRRFIGASSADD